MAQVVDLKITGENGKITKTQYLELPIHGHSLVMLIATKEGNTDIRNPSVRYVKHLGRISQIPETMLMFIIQLYQCMVGNYWNMKEYPDPEVVIVNY